MGTLHEVYQLKPKVLTDGAVIPLKKNARKWFLTNYTKKNNDWGIFSNTFAIDSPNGKVQRIAMYSPQRVLNFQEPGIYIAIQSGSKYGFESHFEESLSSLALHLEDSLFYIIWDHLITKFEITNGVLRVSKANNFNEWEYIFEKYLLSEYQQSPQLIADYYVDLVLEMKLQIEDMIENHDDPGTFYEWEDYEAALNNINHYKDYIPIAVRTALVEWLEEKIIFQKKWEEEHYD